MLKELNYIEGKQVLLLQGPLGPFFKRVSTELSAKGAIVTKVNFNGGDWFFYPKGSINYRGRVDDWPTFLAGLLSKKKIDLVLMYGDCRPVHHCVREQAQRLGVEVGVFEAGYLRPDYITLEHGGINDFSTIPRSARFYSALPAGEPVEPLKVGSVFWHAALWAVLYYIASAVLKPVFPHYRHHRALSVWEAWPWIRGLWRKYHYRLKERKIQRQLVTERSGQFFLVPLQVHYDSQIRVHSKYPSVETFIHEVVSSFAKYAGADMTLVLKHHPMDRAYRDYSEQCESLSEAYGLQGRLLYVHDLELPSILKHARGVVVVNSTVGLSALLHGAPVKVCGRAIYDFSQLTYQGLLEDFWKEAHLYKPNTEVLSRFRCYLIERTQLNGSVYKRLPIEGSILGVVWNPSLRLWSALKDWKTGTRYVPAEPQITSLPYNQLALSLTRYQAITERGLRNRWNDWY